MQFTTNKEDENETEDDKYRCKSLATVYNFFEVKWERGKIINIQIRKGQQDCLMNFLYDEVLYSVEHFIFNDKGKNTIKYSGGELIYTLPSSVKKFVPSLFNFIFINKKINEKILCNYFIQDKIKILEEKGYNFNCEYTNMVIEKVKETFECYPELNGCKTFEEVNAILNNYYETDFKESYGIFVNEIVMEVLAHINPLKN